MEKEAFILTQLSIHKIPGFPKGMEPCKDLAANINIIAGPNASGKSSTAAIIRKLIWRNDLSGISADCSVNIGIAPWEIKIDSGRCLLQRDGKDDTFTGLPAFEESGRYMLALHELFQEEDKELAKQIIKESIGGYDLEKAQQKLQYEDKIYSSRASECKEFRNSEERYKEITNKQKQLLKEEDRLGQLIAECENSRKALSIAGFYELVIQYLQAQLKFDEVSEQYNAFPSRLHKVNGEEYQTIEELEEQAASIGRDVEDCTKKIDSKTSVISALHLPEDGVPEQVLSELEERMEKLEDLDRQVGELDKEIQELQVKESEAQRTIDPDSNADGWSGIDLKEVNGLDQFLNKAQQTLSEKRFLETEIEALAKEKVDDSIKTETIHEGIRALSYWLEEDGNTGGISLGLFAIVSVAGILTAILTFYIGLTGLSGAVIIIVTFIIGFTKKRTGSRIVRERDYTNTGLSFHGSWNQETVIAKIEELTAELERAKWQELIQQKKTSSEKALMALAEPLDKISRVRNEWLEKLGKLPDLPGDNLKSYSGLAWFLQNVKEWQKFNAEIKAFEEKKILLSQAKQEMLEKINRQFAASNVLVAEDVIGAKVILKKLTEDIRTRQTALEEIERQNENIISKQQQKDKLLEKMKGIYDKLEVRFGKKEEIRLLTGQRENFQNVKVSYGVAEQALSNLKRQLEVHSLYECHKTEVSTLTPDQAEEKKKGQVGIAERYEDLNKEIIEIQTEIKREMGGADLEMALAKKDDALDQLEELYDKNLSSLTGQLIIDLLKKESGEQNQSKVFKKANEYFNRITGGRYELRLEERDGAFRSYDTFHKLGQDLGDLSTGTRIQLLLSVRLAFIETQENIIRLPILADELLANSDDIRTEAIINAIGEISKEGRQVFYFTAQSEEVSKWKKYLEANAGITYKIIELAGRPNESIVYNTNLLDLQALAIDNIPKLTGNDHDGYGKCLQVPPFDLLNMEPEQLHLWYLLDDNWLLYQCMLLGISCYGQLQSFIHYGSKIDGIDTGTLACVDRRIKFLARFQELYRKGRALPIDTGILIDSGAVSAKFIGEVSSLLKELNGNPVKLLAALHEGKVTGFRANKIEALEEYLYDGEYMTDEEPLGEEAIVIQLQAYLSILNLPVSEAEYFINKICDSK